MKKILYYSAMVLLLLSSLMVGFITNGEMQIMTISCLLTGEALMLFYVSQARNNFSAFFLYSVAACTHGFYMSIGQPFAKGLLILLVILMLCAVSVLIWECRSKIYYRQDLENALFVKAALIPEVLLNFLMSRQSHDSMFTYFSWILLAITSAYVIAAASAMLKKKIIDLPKALAACLPQFCFFTDLLGCAWLLIKAVRYKEIKAETKKASRMLSSSAFTRSSHKKMRSASNASAHK